MFYGWRIVGGVFFAQMLMTGFMTYSFGLFMVPLQETFGASRAQVNLGMTASTLAGLIMSPVLGALADKTSMRVLMSAGALVFAAGLYGMSLSASIWHFVAIFGLSVCIGSLLLGPLTGSTVISRWFSQHRGKALGVAAVGTSVGGLVLPVVLGYWIAEAGWRNALQNLSLVVLLGLLPLLVMVIRSHPGDLDTHPDGIAPSSTDPAQAAPAITLGEIARHPAYWCIGLTIGLLFSAYSALMANLVPYAQGTGITLEKASALMTVVAGSGLVGKILFGMAADRINLKLGLWLAIGLVFAGLCLLLTEPNYLISMLACVLIGLAAGGMLPVWGALLAEIFGVTSYGRVMGLMNPLITLMVMPGFVITGALYDRFGTYQAAFVLYLVLLAVSALALVPLRHGGRASTSS